jgi:hypothetical protein
MTQSELNSIPLYSRISVYWGNLLPGVLLRVSGDKAIVYIPANWRLIYDYPASGLTLLEVYRPDYTVYSTYSFDTVPLYSTVNIPLVNKTGVIINKDSSSSQLHIFYSDSTVEWVSMQYVEFISAPMTAQIPKPVEEYSPGVQPPGVIRTEPITVDPYTYVAREAESHGTVPTFTPSITQIQEKTTSLVPQGDGKTEGGLSKILSFKVLIGAVLFILIMMPKSDERAVE